MLDAATMLHIANFVWFSIEVAVVLSAFLANQTKSLMTVIATAPPARPGSGTRGICYLVDFY